MESVRLNFAHICENAFLSQESGNLNIIGDFDHIVLKRQLPESPLLYSFYVVTNFTVIPNRKYVQEILIINDSDGSIIAQKKVEQEVMTDKGGVIGQFQVQFPGEGQYHVVIKLNNVIYNELPLKVEVKL